MTKEQQKEAVRLLKEAWTTVDYWNHKGELSVEITQFLDSLVEKQTEDVKNE